MSEDKPTKKQADRALSLAKAHGFIYANGQTIDTWDAITHSDTLWDNFLKVMRNAENSEFGTPAFEEIGNQFEEIFGKNHGARTDWQGIAVLFEYLVNGHECW